MAFTYWLQTSAEEEYLEAYMWYESEAGLGEQFAVAFRKRIQEILNNPEQYGSKRRRFREVKLNKVFPYVIVYMIKGNDSIVITSIFHTSRNPGKKYRK